MTVVVVLAAAWLAVGAGFRPASADGLRFPKPERPVAPITTSAYSTEEARDRHREAERVIDRLRLARRMGPGATIYAQDVERRHLDRLAARLARDGIAGVTLVHGAPVDPRLPANSVDVAILSHMYPSACSIPSDCRRIVPGSSSSTAAGRPEPRAPTPRWRRTTSGSGGSW